MRHWKHILAFCVFNILCYYSISAALLKRINLKIAVEALRTGVLYC